MIDPVMALLKTTTTLLPTPTNTGKPVNPTSVAPIPTITPTKPDYQLAGQTGTRTLWYGSLPLLLDVSGYCADSKLQGRLHCDGDFVGRLCRAVVARSYRE